MAVPKKRTGAKAQATRRSHWKAIKPATTKCSHCGATVLAHTVCTECGYYKGKAVSIKSADYQQEDTKAAKKTTKKAEKEVVEVKEEAQQEETKAEETTEVKAEEQAAETENKTEE